MKKVITLLSCLLIMGTAAFAEPSAIILKAFKDAFPAVDKVEWYEGANATLAYFTQNGVTAKVTFDKEGNFVRSLRYYDEKNLPINILCSLKKKYAGKKIFGVTETASTEGIYYYVKLVDDKNWYTVKATPDAALEVVEKYNKQAED